MSLVLVAIFPALDLAWRWASRTWSIPCPAFLAWSLENPSIQRFDGSRIILDRLGPRRLIMPAAKQMLPEGEAVGIDIRPAMIERLKRRVERVNMLLRSPVSDTMWLELHRMQV
jgi:hypothetical protein